MNTPVIVSDKVVYPELSYEVVGAAFRVFNNTGYGMAEKYYQQAYAKELENSQISFEREKPVKIYYQNQNLGHYFLDFVVENKIVVELKVRPKIGYTHIRQVMSYLKTSGYKVAIVIYFTREGVKYRRIINAV